MLHSHPFVQHVANSKDKSPVLILYTNEQLIDFRRSYCAETITESSVVGCDKTFNLGPLHLTTTVFKQPSVMRTTTGDSPIFFGPMCLHGNSDFSTWSILFKHLIGHCLGWCPFWSRLWQWWRKGLNKVNRKNFPKQSQTNLHKAYQRKLHPPITEQVGHMW